MNFVTTNIRLSEEDYLRLKAEAAKSRVSFSEVVRQKVGSQNQTVNKKKTGSRITPKNPRPGT